MFLHEMVKYVEMTDNASVLTQAFLESQFHSKLKCQCLSQFGLKQTFKNTTFYTKLTFHFSAGS